MTTRGWKCYMRESYERLCVICFVIWPTTRILQWRNVNEYRLPSKNAHSPNYCSWLAVCVNYSANFYCKITLINRFKLYLIKTYSKTPKNKKKLNVNKNNVKYILRLHLVNVTWRHPGWHYNWVTLKRWTYDNAQRHVTAFRPISDNIFSQRSHTVDTSSSKWLTRQHHESLIWYLRL